MFRHYLIAALRNMAANRLTTAIAIFGLALGITAAILMALVIRNQLAFDHFIPGHERTFVGVSESPVPGRATNYSRKTNRAAAGLLRLNVPEVESVARLILADKDVYRSGAMLRRVNVAASESLYWADANLFEVLPLPVYRGDLKTALARADGMVLPRAMARKYFGRDDAVGQTMSVDGHPMTVRAVIEDLPANGTELQSGIFASGLAGFSAFAQETPDGPGNFSISVMTYLRLKPGAAMAGVEDRLRQLLAPLVHTGSGGASYAMRLLPLDRLNLFEGLYPGARTRLVIAGLVGFVVLFIAAVNFVNLLTARAARRALEVGVRKACGADRGIMVVQFLGEAVLTVLLATCAALALAEFLLPPLNAFIATGAALDYWREPALPAALVLGVALLGLAAGGYPAFVLSAFRPASVLKDPAKRSGQGGAVRNLLVVAQFAVLVTLAVAAVVIWQQRNYATQTALRADIDDVLMVRGGCRAPAFLAELRRLPGVAAASCSGIELLDNSNSTEVFYRGQPVTMDNVTAAPGIFAVYGIKPVAGALAAGAGDYDPQRVQGVVLNEAAVRRLGIASPQAAIGQLLPHPGNGRRGKLMPIAAVVPDFAFYSVERALEPTAYVPEGGMAEASIKLRGDAIPATLTAIDRLWAATGNTEPVTRFFLDAHMQEQYLGMVRQGQLLGIFAALAVMIACLGLFALLVSTTERRIKEIGIRKAMGATTLEIVALLLWQFSRPVLLANLVAWPLAFWLMRRWLAGFAYHVDLQVWVFAAASLGALLVALLTVAGQAWLTARAKPVLALRYE
jgi:putative ABC transport system permease protein